MLRIQLDADELKPLVRQIVGEVLAEVEERFESANGQLAFDEPMAAELLGLRPHQLRDERLKGRIGFTRVAGRRIRYSREHLRAYLARLEEAPTD